LIFHDSYYFIVYSITLNYISNKMSGRCGEDGFNLLRPTLDQDPFEHYQMDS
jgi:hypothetical protein